MKTNEPCAIGTDLNTPAGVIRTPPPPPAPSSSGSRSESGGLCESAPRETGPASAACAEAVRDGCDWNHRSVPVVHCLSIDMTDADAAFDDFCGIGAKGAGLDMDTSCSDAMYRGTKDASCSAPGEARYSPRIGAPRSSPSAIRPSLGEDFSGPRTLVASTCGRPLSVEVVGPKEICALVWPNGADFDRKALTPRRPFK